MDTSLGLYAASYHCQGAHMGHELLGLRAANTPGATYHSDISLFLLHHRRRRSRAAISQLPVQLLLSCRRWFQNRGVRLRADAQHGAAGGPQSIYVRLRDVAGEGTPAIVGG